MLGIGTAGFNGIMRVSSFGDSKWGESSGVGVGVGMLSLWVGRLCIGVVNGRVVVTGTC